MLKCPDCGKSYSIMSKYCKDCGKKLIEKQPNTCSNPECPNSRIKLSDNDRYCEECGSQTVDYLNYEKYC